MANHIAEVAQMLGVKIGETFKLTDDTQSDYPGDYQNYYRFTENNCLEISDDGVEWKTTIASVLLRRILIGDIGIIKLPWKPRKGEKYYVPRIAVRPEDRHCYYYWTNDDINIDHYRMGLVCKTPEEAIALTEKMLAVAKEGKNNG